MGIDWAVASIDFGNYASMGKLLEFLFDDDDFLERLLWTWSLRPLSLAGRELQSSHIRQSCYNPGPKRFADLPVELIDMIFLELDGITDYIGLALTCWQCLRIADKHIRKCAQACTGPWAGDRIICVGDIEPGNLPPQLRTADVQNALLKDGQPISLRVYMDDHFTNLDLGPGLFSLDDYYWLCLLSDAEQQIVDAIQRQYGRPRQQPLFVLRNLSRRVYVSEKALWPFNQYLQKEDQQCVGLGSVLITHICWTESGGDASEPSLERGKWAGDRFDIVSEDEMLKCIASGETWTDVGTEIMKTTIEMWQYNDLFCFYCDYDPDNTGSESGDDDHTENDDDEEDEATEEKDEATEEEDEATEEKDEATEEEDEATEEEDEATEEEGATQGDYTEKNDYVDVDGDSDYDNNVDNIQDDHNNRIDDEDSLKEDSNDVEDDNSTLEDGNSVKLPVGDQRTEENGSQSVHGDQQSDDS